MSVAELNTDTVSFGSLHKPSIQKLHHVFHDAEGWLLRAGKSGIRKFFLGLIHELDDLNVIRRFIILFSSASQKDYVYTRSRCNPGLPSDATTKSLHKEFSAELIKEKASETLKWYREADNHCKITFILYIAKLCTDTGIAHQACNLCKTLLSRRKAELIAKHGGNEVEGVNFDALSLDSSNYSYHTDDHPELYQIATMVAKYGEIEDSLLHDSKCKEDHSSPAAPKVHIRKKLDVDLVSASSSTDEGDENARICLITTSHSAMSGIAPRCDFIALLPVHLSKHILGMLSRTDLSSCALVHSRWHQLVSQVRSDEFSLQIIKEEAILMQGVSAKGSNPSYARFRPVLVPVVDEITQEIMKQDTHSHLSLTPKRDGEEHLFESIFRGLETKFVDIEERNVYCGAYNLLVLDQRSNSNRVIGYAGQDNLVIGFTDKVIRTVDVSSGRIKKPHMHGHPASITALYMGTKEQGCIFSGSYDTTIRKWNINTGFCQLILHGHRSSITYFDLSGDLLVSGAQDGLVKVWNIVTGNCTCTFKHSRKFSVTCVQIQQNTIVSSCERGLVKVWNLKTRKIVKTLNNHGGMKVNCVRFNQYFLLSGGNDDYLLLWSMPGKQSICLKAYRHPKPVLCIELKYMCAITGCADGKIRVINMLSGDCLRVLRGNSQCDPIVNIFATEDRLLVNTSSNCLVMHFEPVTWEYNSFAENLSSEPKTSIKAITRRPVSSTLLHSVSRAKRFSLASASDRRVFKRTSSAPPGALKKPPSSAVIHSFVRGPRPPSHFIDLQPEFRRPRSGVTISAPSTRPVSSMSVYSSRTPSRAVSASSRRSQSIRPSSGSPTRNPGTPFSSKVWPMGNKYTTITRDNVLMRVGMLNHVKKKEAHNINTELNSISYFDRFFPRTEIPQTASRFADFHPASYPTLSKATVGKFTTEEEEIRDVKLVLKQGFPYGEYQTSKTSVYMEPNLDPLRMNFSFMKKQDDAVDKSGNSVIHVDNFLNCQLGITKA